MANDVIPHPVGTMEILLDWISRPDVGCVFPYFSSNRGVGDEVQRVGFSSRGGIACEPSTMTLSLNLFKRQVLEQICGLDENYLFGFAEPILLIKIRSLGFRAVMAGGTHASHYDQLTKLLGARAHSVSTSTSTTPSGGFASTPTTPPHPVWRTSTFAGGPSPRRSPSSSSGRSARSCPASRPERS